MKSILGSLPRFFQASTFTPLQCQIEHTGLPEKQVCLQVLEWHRDEVVSGQRRGDLATVLAAGEVPSNRDEDALRALPRQRTHSIPSSSPGECRCDFAKCDEGWSQENKRSRHRDEVIDTPGRGYIHILLLSTYLKFSMSLSPQCNVILGQVYWVQLNFVIFCDEFSTLLLKFSIRDTLMVCYLCCAYILIIP